MMTGKLLVAGCLLLAGVGLAADSAAIQRAVKDFVRGGSEVRETTFTCQLLTRDAVIKAAVRQDTGEVNIDLHGTPGRWQRLIYFLGKGNRQEFPEVAVAREPDGSKATVICEIPITADGHSVGTLSLQAVELAAWPGWLFYRIAEPASDIVANLYLGVAMRPQPILKRPRQLYLAWPGGSAALGEEVPWFGRRPDFNAWAWYSHGGDEEDLMAEFIVFDPALFEPVGAVRWKSGDDRGVLSLVPAAREFFFALGQHRGADDPRGVVIPGFLGGGNEAILNALRGVDWLLQADWDKLACRLDELKRTVEQLGGESGARADYDNLKARFDQAREAGNGMDYFNITREAEVLGKKLSSSLLEELLR